MNTHRKLFAPAPLAVAAALAFGGSPVSEAQAADCPEVISGNRNTGCTVPAGQNLQISASGTITATEEAAVLIDHPGPGVTTLRNSGTLSGGSDATVWLNDTEITGDLLNNRNGRITYDGIGGAALRLDNSTVHGNIANAGLIYSGDANAAVAIDHSQIDGNLINYGTLQGNDFAQNAVRMTYAQLGGDFINRGDIVGGGSGTGVVISFGQIDGSFINENLITDNNGVTLGTQTVLGDVINRGIISGTFNPDGGGQGMSVGNAHIGGDIKNTGTIEGATGALRLTNTQLDGRLYNSGRISGTPGPGGAAAGIDLAGTTTVPALVNNGLIQGATYALRVADTARLDALNIAGNDTAIFAGEVYAPRTTVSVYSNATYTLQDGNLFTVDQFINRGVLGVAATNISGDAAQATIAGDYRQTASGTLRTHVQDADHYGKLVVTGIASLPSQAKIDVDVSDPAQPFTASRLSGILSAGTLRSDGTFAVTSNSALFDFDAQKNGNAVDLTLSAKPGSSASAAVATAELTQAVGAAQVLDAQFAKGSASPLSAYFVSATSASEVARDLAQSLPSGDASLRANQAALGQISNALQSRLLPTGMPTTDLRQGPAPTFWSQPFNTLSGNRDASSGQVLGFDSRTSPTQRIGVAFAYARGGTQGDAFGGSAQDSSLDLWNFTGYSAHTLAPNTELLVYAGAGHDRIDNQRNLALGGASGAAKAGYDSLFATIGASLGHAYEINAATRLIPALRLDYSHIRDEGYREHGDSSIGPLLLDVHARQTDQLIAGLDGRLEHSLSPGGTTLRLSLGVGYDLVNEPTDVTASFAGAPGQNFTVHSEPASPWLLRGGIGVASPLSERATLTVNYALQQRSDYTDQGGSVGVEWAF